MEKAKYGKMRQVNAVNGSQMVVKIGGSYYRWVKGMKGDKLESPINFLAAVRTMLIIGYMQKLSTIRTSAIHVPNEDCNSTDGKADIA